MPTATKTAQATNGKQDTPLADNEPAKPGLPRVDLAALAGKIDWDKLPEPKTVAKTPKDLPKVAEEDIPAPIKVLVESALRAEEYMDIVLEDETVRAAFVQFVRTYCYVRSEPFGDEFKENAKGRLSSRVTIQKDGKTVRYSVSPFKERKKGAK